MSEPTVPAYLSLAGRTALVCGASQGIGAATASALAAYGARVVLLARSADRLKDVAAGLPGQDLGHKALACDLGDRAALDARLDELLRTSGPVHILIANAGGPPSGPVTSATDDAFRAAMETHLLASHHLVQRLLPGMRTEGFGRIINIISTSVKTPLPNLGVSNTVRAAVASWAKTLSTEVAPHGITVNSVLPGYTMTPRLTALIEGVAARTGKPVAAVAEEWRKSVPAGRFAEPAEVAAVIAFLATPAAAYVNGVALPVDGGRTPTL